MAHAFLVKDIAFQAGLSTATVDRVINGRDGVRWQTVARVEAAINELRQQESAAATSGRVHVFDIVMEAPDRFTNAVRRALESEAATFLPVIVRSRFHFTEQMRDADLSRLMARIRRRGSHGVVLKAPDTDVIRTEVAAMVAAGIPVITLVTDLPDSGRIAYAGSDNRVAGETAAYLIGSRIGSASGTVLLTLSSSRFRGEEERENAFRRIAAARYPDLVILEISEGYGKDSATGAQVRKALETHGHINAVYSIGGG
ncbi:MAG: transcriptional regulator, LacI family, partial [Rhizobium sp.]|nr:transcriptional regulator, LacI family [Rhizobium sp.]